MTSKKLGRYQNQRNWHVVNEFGKVIAKFRYQINAIKFIQKNDHIIFEKLEVKKYEIK